MVKVIERLPPAVFPFLHRSEYAQGANFHVLPVAKELLPLGNYQIAKVKIAYLASWLSIAALPLVCGCANDQRPTYRAGGTVTQGNGKPLPGGWIEFQWDGSISVPTARAKIQPDGHFELGTYGTTDGAFEGNHQVMILPPVPPFVKPKRGPLPGADDPRYPQIHPRYRRFESSGLTFTVTPEVSANHFEIRLED